VTALVLGVVVFWSGYAAVFVVGAVIAVAGAIVLIAKRRQLPGPSDDSE
jgi:predicted MFS family arabinose efflux permease